MRPNNPFEIPAFVSVLAIIAGFLTFVLVAGGLGLICIFNAGDLCQVGAVQVGSDFAGVSMILAAVMASSALLVRHILIRRQMNPAIVDLFGDVEYTIPKQGEHVLIQCLLGWHWWTLVRHHQTGDLVGIHCGICRRVLQIHQKPTAIVTEGGQGQ